MVKRNPMLGLISSEYTKYRYTLVEDMNYCVYFVTDGDCVKIGITASLPTRIKQLQNGNPRKIEALYVIDAETQTKALEMEKNLHKWFRRNRQVGEWFDITDREIKYACRRFKYTLQIPSSKFDFDIDGIQII